MFLPDDLLFCVIMSDSYEAIFNLSSDGIAPSGRRSPRDDTPKGPR
jgi:hypothetical protein